MTEYKYVAISDSFVKRSFMSGNNKTKSVRFIEKTPSASPRRSGALQPKPACKTRHC